MKAPRGSRPIYLRSTSQARRRARGAQLSSFSSQPHTYLGMLYKARGAWEDASRCFSEAVALARSMPYPYAEAKLSYEYGMLHLREKEPARARERLRAALEIFRRLGAKQDAEQTRQTLQGFSPRKSG